MSDELTALRDRLCTVFPGSRIEPLSVNELSNLTAEYPALPENYLSFLRHIGWGSFGSGDFMVYSGPCESTDFFDAERAKELAHILFIGDDLAGWMVGFDTINEWSLVGVDSCSPSPVRLQTRTIAEFFWQRIADNIA